MSQTAGKGRNNKNWHSPAQGNIYASYIIKNCRNIILQSSWIGGLAALKTLREVSSLENELWIKWPNDIFCDEKKICGILCESSISQSKPEDTAVIIGIGINVNCTSESLKSIVKPCTSLNIETGNIYELRSIRENLKNNLDLYYNLIINSGIETLYNIWKKENRLLGKKIIVSTSENKSHEVKVLDIDKTGAIVGFYPDGSIRKVYSGDVSVKHW